jgi:hypothetical protein
MPREDYEARQAARQARYERAAERASAKAAQAYKRADMSEAATGIPFGQPILVGHHSEGRHRAAIKRADNAMRTSIEESKKASYYAAKAANIGAGGVSSDDPTAIEQLQTKLAKLEARQEMMQEANKLVRKNDVDGLVALGFSRAQAEQCVTVPVWGNKFCAFEPYQLSNNGATIRATKHRIAQLEREAQRETVESETNIGVKIIENTEANRVQLIFDEKPSPEQRAILKSRGFRWSPTEGAWQRLLNNAGIYAARYVVQAFTPDE